MATVFLAEDLGHDRQVAIKVLKLELAAVPGAERFLRRSGPRRRCSHPSVLPLFDSGTVEGFLYNVMPYVKSESFWGRLNLETRLGG